jgi:hypothetical protein
MWYALLRIAAEIGRVPESATGNINRCLSLDLLEISKSSFWVEDENRANNRLDDDGVVVSEHVSRFIHECKTGIAQKKIGSLDEVDPVHWTPFNLGFGDIERLSLNREPNLGCLFKTKGEKLAATTAEVDYENRW